MRRSGQRWGYEAFGAAVWAVAAVAGGVTGRLGTIETLLLLAVLVLAPLAAPLHDVSDAARRVALVAGVAATAALLLDTGPVATALAVPWVLVAAWLAGVAARRWWRGTSRLDAIPTPVALAYLTVGAVWLLADRAASSPAGITPPFVELTAVHFHHAGFVATTVVAAGRNTEGRLAVAATAMVVAAPPVVALGFLAVPVLQVVGAVLLTAGTWTAAAGVWLHASPGAAGVLLRLAGIAVLVPMALATHWALGSATGLVDPLPIATMAATHGVLNGVGFGLLGLIGRRLGRDGDPRPPTRPGPAPDAA